MSQQINLANPQLLHKRYAFGLREMALGAAGLLAAGLVWAGVLFVQANAIEARAAEQEARLATAQQELAQIQAAASRAPSALLVERVDAVQRQVTQRELLLASIGGASGAATEGFASRLRALAHSHSEGVWLNAFILAPDALTLKGSALDASLLTAYLERLGRQAPFAGLKFSGMNAAPAQSAGPRPGAAPGQPGQVGQVGQPVQPGQVDFELYAGKRENPAQGGAAHDQ